MEQEMVHKVTLSSGKVVLVRDFKIKHRKLATQAIGHAKVNELTAGVSMMDEYVKMLVCKINDKIPSATEMQDLDSIFSYKEYMQVSNFISNMAGLEEIQSPKTEMVTFGAQ